MVDLWVKNYEALNLITEKFVQEHLGTKKLAGPMCTPIVMLCRQKITYFDI